MQTRSPASRRGVRLSRRAFVAAGTALFSARWSPVQARALTARDVAARIQASVGVPWRDGTVDGFKAGDPATPVTGIATTAMATLDVLRRAAAAKRNFVLTREPTFYAATDEPGARAGDPVYLAKQAFIAEHRLIVWRLSDHWPPRTSDETTRALAAVLGWATPDRGNSRVYVLQETTVGEAARHIRNRLGIRGGMRVVGALDARVRRALLIPGATDLAGTIAGLREADLIVCGEPREWEAVEYVADTAAAGMPRSMIALGRIVSEEPGMRACADWLRTLIPELPVEAISVGDPYWRPRA